MSVLPRHVINDAIGLLPPEDLRSMRYVDTSSRAEAMKCLYEASTSDVDYDDDLLEILGYLARYRRDGKLWLSEMKSLVNGNDDELPQILAGRDELMQLGVDHQDLHHQ